MPPDSVAVDRPVLPSYLVAVVCRALDWWMADNTLAREAIYISLGARFAINLAIEYIFNITVERGFVVVAVVVVYLFGYISKYILC